MITSNKATKIRTRYFKIAFENAILKALLFHDEDEYNFVGNYMYMHSDDTHDYFKHIDTRNYVKVPIY
jgi:hypothetical protein